MGEKSGNGYLATNGGKSSRKSTGGKDDDSTKPKKGKKVQFDYEGKNTPESNGKVNTPAAKAGKGDKKANAAKKPEGKVPSLVKLELELPPNSTFLMDCEAAESLIGIQDQMVFLSQDPEIKIPVPFDMALMYAKRHGNYGKPRIVKKILEPLKQHGVSDSEICLIANICPDSVDEVIALLPSLKSKIMKVREPIRFALDELANLKHALANLGDPI